MINNNIVKYIMVIAEIALGRYIDGFRPLIISVVGSIGNTIIIIASVLIIMATFNFFDIKENC